GPHRAVEHEDSLREDRLQVVSRCQPPTPSATGRRGAYGGGSRLAHGLFRRFSPGRQAATKLSRCFSVADLRDVYRGRSNVRTMPSAWSTVRRDAPSPISTFTWYACHPSESSRSGRWAMPTGRTRDRKSTRLNSSHGS